MKNDEQISNTEKSTKLKKVYNTIMQRFATNKTNQES